MRDLEKKTISFVTNEKIYDWLQKEADNIGITLSAYVAVRIAELKKQDDRLY